MHADACQPAMSKQCVTGRVEIKIIKPLIWIYHITSATIANWSWCITVIPQQLRTIAATE
jgi:hypothetical protein